MSCCKGRPRVHGSATLWKINRTDGTLIWAGDRGANSAAFEVVVEGADTVIYEGGTYASSVLALTKWIDRGDGGDVLWRFAKDTRTINTLQKSAFDDSIWLSHTTTTACRVDEDGSEINAGTVTANRIGLARRSNGNMNFFSINDGVSQYTPAFTLAASLSTAAAGDIRPMSVNQNSFDADAGWAWNNTATTLRQYTSAISLDNTYSASVGDVLAANDVRVFTDDAGVFSVSPLALMHTISVAGAPTQGKFDADNNVYFVYSDAGTPHIAMYDDSNSEVWDREIVGAGQLFLSPFADKLYVATGGLAFDLDDAADNYILASLDLATGETEWGINYCRVSGSDCMHVVGDVIYVCGNRVIV